MNENDTPEGCRRLAGMAQYEANRTEGSLKAAWQSNADALRARAEKLEREQENEAKASRI